MTQRPAGNIFHLLIVLKLVFCVHVSGKCWISTLEFPFWARQWDLCFTIFLNAVTRRHWNGFCQTDDKYSKKKKKFSSDYGILDYPEWYIDDMFSSTMLLWYLIWSNRLLTVRKKYILSLIHTPKRHIRWWVSLRRFITFGFISYLSPQEGPSPGDLNVQPKWLPLIVRQRLLLFEDNYIWGKKMHLSSL